MKIIESNRMKELTMSQLAIWIASMLEENNTIYNLGEAIEILGPIDVNCFMQSLDHVAATTEALHLQFIDTPEGPRQYIDHDLAWENIYLDFKDKPDPKQSAFEWIQHHIETPIDLTHDPLFKIVLFELGEDHFFCYYFVHHICNDGFAASIVMKKVSDDYSARISGQQPLQTEMAPWENLFEYEQQYIDSKSHRQDRAYWLQELVDYPQPATISGRSPGRPGGSVESVRVLSRTKIAHIQQQMNDYGISFPQLLITLAAFYMHQLTSEDDLLLGIPVTARMGKKIRETVAMLANIVPMRLQISHDETLLSLAQQVKGKMRQLLRHQRYRREELREALGLDPDQPELYGMVVNINSFAYDLNFGNSQCHVHNVGTRPVNDLQLVIFDHIGDEDLQFKLFGKTGHYSTLEINSLLDRFLTLLTSIDDDTLMQPLATLTSMTDEDYTQAVTQYNQTDHPVTPTHLTALFEQQVNQNSQAIGLIGHFLGEQSVSELSYQALDQLSNQMAHCLSNHGVRPGMRVGICLERSIDLIVALLGILKLGAAYVPMATDLPAARIEFICRDTGASLLVTHAVVAESLSKVQCFSFEARQLARWPAYPVDVNVDPDFLAYIIFTSGSTGQPKGVAVRHRPAVNLIEWVNQRYQVGPQDRLLFVTSVSFDLSVYDIFGTLAAGGSLYIASHEETHDPALLLDVIYQQKITFWDSAPAFIQQLLPLLPTDDVRENHLRLAFFSGDWIPLTLAERLKQCFSQLHVVGLGGATEATIWSNWFDIGEIHPDWNSIPYGLPIHNARYYVLDRHLNPLPIGVAGDLYIGGECLADGYYQRPALTAERFIPDPFSEQPGRRLYCTGDRAKRMADGQLEFIGRVDDQVKVRGYRIEPGEVQAALLSHPGVEQAAAVVRDDGPSGHYLVAYVIPQSGYTLDAETLRLFLFDRLPEYMVPTSYMMLTAFPLTANGKLDKAALPKPEELLADFIAPVTETECQISQYFSELTQVESVGIHDNFFSLGGDSLLATQLLVRLRTAFEAQLSMGTIFDTPTVAALARYIDSNNSAPALVHPLPDKLPDESDRLVSVPSSGEHPKDAPLSFTQMRLWFIHQLQGQSCEYHIPVALRLHGEIHLPSLIAAIQQVVDTHTILSAQIIGTEISDSSADDLDRHDAGGVSQGKERYPRQQTVHPIVFNVPVADIRRLNGAEKEAKIEQILAHEWELPFDLSAGPLFRAQIIQVESDTCILSFTCHHLISDGWSMNILKRQIFENYQRILNADDHHILTAPSTTRHYFEFAQADHALECEDRYKQELTYWQQKLAGIPAELLLASDYERPAEPDYHANVVQSALTATQVAGLKRVGERLNGVTPYMILLSALSIVLSRFSGESDIVLGSPVANRQSEEWEDVIGLFVSTIALRIQLQPHLRFSDVLLQAKQTCIEAYQHQSVPFDRLVDALALERHLNVSPVFQVMLAMQNTPKDDVGVDSLTDDLTIESIFGTGLKTRFDVELHAVPVEQGIALHWLYKTSLFKAERVAAWAETFNTLINQIIETPDQFIAGSNILPLHDRNRELITFNQTDAPVAVTSLANMFEQQVVRSGGAIAVQGQSMGSLSTQIQLTYGQLNTRANQLAHYLLAQGIEPGMRIGLCLDRTIELIVSMLAVVKIGAAYVPLDSEWPAERLDLILEDTAASLVLTQHRYVAQISKADCLCWEDLNLANQPAHNPAIHVPAEFLAYIIFTSGSTGVPKGVAMQHGPACHLIHWVNERYQVSADDHLLFVTSPCFDLSVYDVFGILAAGARLTIVPKDQLKDPHGLVQMIDKYQITFWDSAPAFMQQLTPVLAEMSTSDFQNNLKMRLAFFSGDWIPLTLPGALKQAYPNIQVVGLGGATEAAIWSNWFDITEVQPQWSSIPYGLPITNAQYYILDTMKLPVPSGVTGDLYIAGECLASGYYNRPGLTAERFIPNPFAQSPGGRLYNTGDRARRLPDGNIEFMGRLDQQVKVRGFRIELGEIQAALLAHPDIAQAFVTVRRDGPSGNYLLAYIVFALPQNCPNSDDGQETRLLQATEKLKTYLAASLPDYMIPSVFVSLDEFPLTVNGKLDVKALPSPTRQGHIFTAPRTQEESILCRLFEEVLSIEQVGVDDNFFELGGDSIVTIMLVQKARQMDLTIDIKAIFQQQTPAKIAAVIQPMSPELAGSEATDQVFDNTLVATPVMQWMFERHDQFNSFSQTMLLRLPDVSERGQLTQRIQSLLQWLVNKHDMLRLIIHREESHDEHRYDGRRWVFDIQPPGQIQSTDFIVQYDLFLGSGTLLGGDGRETARNMQLSTIAMETIRQLDPESGQVIRAAILYEEDDEAQHASLLLSIHHLSVDGVSWHLLCEDLKSGWEMLAQGHSLFEEAQQATAHHRLAFAQWGHALLEDAYSPAVVQHLPYWQTLTSNSYRCPPVFASESVTPLASARHLRVEMSDSVVNLLTAFSTSFHGRLEDVLVLALTVAINQWRHTCQQPTGPVLLDIESHGRYCNPQDPSNPQQARARVAHDLLETVGWFTAIYPVMIDIDDFNLSEILWNDYEMARALKAVKEQLRQIPALMNDEGEVSQEGRGMSYGLLRYLNRDIDPSTLTPCDVEIAFNYLGHIRSDSNRPWSPDLTAAASLQVPDEEICLIHPLSVNTSIQTHDGQTTLVSDWIWAGSHIDLATVETLASHWQATLETLAHHYQALKTTGGLKSIGCYTPSDFPLTRLTEPQLERIEQSYPELEAILPLSTLQEGLLFHTYFDQQMTDLYMVQLGVEVTGSLDMSRLKRSFAQLLERHPILRSAFFQEDIMCKVVSRQVDMPWIEQDLSHLSRAEAELQAKLLRQAEKNKRFNLACSPLLRVLMVKMPGAVSSVYFDAYQLVITHHHILMDGWSIAIFIKELFCFYNAGNEVPRLPFVPPYARYLSWMKQQEKEPLIHWWQDYLKDFSEPSRLADAAYTEATTYCPELLEKTLPISLTQQLSDIARSLHITLNSVLQGVWGLMMAKYTGKNDIAFGIIVSGRPPEVQGVERMIGLFISTLPLRIRYDPMQSLQAFLCAVQQNHALMTEHQYISLSEIQRAAGGRTLFDTLIVLENYPLDQALLHEPAPGLKIGQIFPDDGTHYPVSLIITPGEQLGLRLQYSQTALSSEKAIDLLDAFTTLLAEAVLAPEQPMGQISIITPEEPRQEIEMYNQTATAEPQLRSQSYCAPRNHQEYQLCQLFSEVLPVKQIGIDDNFFDLGGHSILAAQLIRKIEIATGVKMTIRALFEMPTVRELAASLASEEGLLCSSVVDPIFPIRTNGQMPPLFCIHPIDGLSWCYSGLIGGVHHHRPIYGIQATGLTGDAELPSSIEAMAREYVALIQQVQPTGPYHLLGGSLGGYIAQAIACQLQMAQEEVALLALMDCYPMSGNDALPVWDEQAVLQGVATSMEIELGDIQPETLTMKLFIDAARKQGHLLGHLEDETGEQLITLMQAYRQMVPEFRPQTFAGDMLFFAATEDEEITIQWEEPVSSANWQPYVTGQIETRLMRCAHTEMSNPEHLREIGLRIERYLSGRSAKNEVMDG